MTLVDCKTVASAICDQQATGSGYSPPDVGQPSHAFSQSCEIFVQQSVKCDNICCAIACLDPARPNSGCQDRLASIQVCRGEELISQQLQAPHLGTTGIRRRRVSPSDPSVLFSPVSKVLHSCNVSSLKTATNGGNVHNSVLVYTWY